MMYFINKSMQYLTIRIMALLMPVLSCFSIQALAANDSVLYIACVGDSTTFGMNIDDREHLSYPAQLQQLLGEKFVVGNFGANGATAIRSTPRREPYITRDVYQKSLDSEPDVVILTLGANDSKASFWDEQQYQTDLTLLLEEYLALTPIVMLGLPAPAFNQPGKWDVNETNLIRARQLVLKIAADYHLKVVDFHSPLLDEDLFQADGVHPNRYGAQKMAYAAKNHLGL